MLATVVTSANGRGRSPALHEGKMFMKRILLLVTVALMLAGAMALTGVAQAKSPIGNKADAKCLALASKTLQPGFNFSDYTFDGGTEGPDVFTGTAGTAEVFCGFNNDESTGVDYIDTLAAGDIFLVGSGRGHVENNFGTVYGGASGDFVLFNEGVGTFYGGAGDDGVLINEGAFYGGAGLDHVTQNEGAFYGGDGDDEVSINTTVGTFYGGAGDDHVLTNHGFFDGGDGTDTVVINSSSGTIINVP
jgi:hypothetical protein